MTRTVVLLLLFSIIFYRNYEYFFIKHTSIRCYLLCCVNNVIDIEHYFTRSLLSVNVHWIPLLLFYSKIFSRKHFSFFEKHKKKNSRNCVSLKHKSCLSSVGVKLQINKISRFFFYRNESVYLLNGLLFLFFFFISF